MPVWDSEQTRKAKAAWRASFSASSIKAFSCCLCSLTIVHYFKAQLVVSSTVGNALFTKAIFLRPTFYMIIFNFSTNIQKRNFPEYSCWTPLQACQLLLLVQHTLWRTSSKRSCKNLSISFYNLSHIKMTNNFKNIIGERQLSSMNSTKNWVFTCKNIKLDLHISQYENKTWDVLRT